jgi:hypothetical protein
VVSPVSVRPGESNLVGLGKRLSFIWQQPWISVILSRG